MKKNIMQFDPKNASPSYDEMGKTKPSSKRPIDKLTKNKPLSFRFMEKI